MGSFRPPHPNRTSSAPFSRKTHAWLTLKRHAPSRLWQRLRVREACTNEAGWAAIEIVEERGQESWRTTILAIAWSLHKRLCLLLVGGTICDCSPSVGRKGIYDWFLLSPFGHGGDFAYFWPKQAYSSKSRRRSKQAFFWFESSFTWDNPRQYVTVHLCWSRLHATLVQATKASIQYISVTKLVEFSSSWNRKARDVEFQFSVCGCSYRIKKVVLLLYPMRQGGRLPS